MNFDLLNPLHWRKSFLLIILGGFVFIWFMFIDTYSIWTRIELNQQLDELKVKTKKLNHESKVLKKEIDKLQTDPSLLERIAREQYGMKKKGETIYKIKKDK